MTGDLSPELPAIALSQLGDIIEIGCTGKIAMSGMPGFRFLPCSFYISFQLQF